MSLSERLLLLCLALVPLAAGADERILAYHADITVSADGSLLVNETIRVRAEGQQIRQGIYRDFPTKYRDRLGNHYQVEFEVLNVRRNGRPEPYHVARRSNGKRGVYRQTGHFDRRG